MEVKSLFQEKLKSIYSKMECSGEKQFAKISQFVSLELNVGCLFFHIFGFWFHKIHKKSKIIFYKWIYEKYGVLATILGTYLKSTLTKRQL